MTPRPASGVARVALIALLGACSVARPAPATPVDPGPERSAPSKASDSQRGAQTRPLPTSSHPAVDRLVRDLTAILSEPAVDHALWAARVNSLDTDESLFTYNAHRLMVPASNQKVLTAAVAADRLGWDYRFTTRLMTNGVIDASGTLQGDLFVIGDGDPSINPRHPERWSVFDEWGTKLRALGVRVIAGHLIGDDDLVDEPGWGEGWSWDDLQYGYGAPAAALQYNENQIEVAVGPGMAIGSPAVVITSPLGSGLLVDSSAVTASAKEETKIDVSRLPGTLFLMVRGQIAQGAKPVTALAAVDNPTRLYLSALREALARHEIFVGGSAIDIDELRTVIDTRSRTSDSEGSPIAADGTPLNLGGPTLAELAEDKRSLRELIVDRSPPLSEIVDVMMKWSRNGYAETLLIALSPLAPLTTPASLQAPTPATARTAARGLEALQFTLDEWGITKTAFRSRDGSGLSRMDYVSADSLVRLLTRMWMNPRLREPFRATLPLAGVSGTLAARLKGTPGMGHVWAKTGTLSNVRALSGYLETRAGETLVFSILVNNFVVPVSDIDKIIDRVLLKLVDLPRRQPRR